MKWDADDFYELRRGEIDVNLIYHLESKDCVTRLMEKFPKAVFFNRNPILTRRLDFSSIHDGNLEYCESISTLLEMHGKHLYHLTIEFESGNTSTQYYDWLHQWISQTPKLRPLRLKFYDKKRDSNLNLKEQKDLWEKIELAPLPPLSHLQYLYACDLPITIA